MQFLMLLIQVLPLLPGIVRAVESIHGAGNGEAKLKSALGLVTAVVPAVAEHVASDPANGSTLSRVISAVVSALNAAGSWADGVNKPAASAGALAAGASADKAVGS